MDRKYRTLYAVLDALLAEGSLLTWNATPNRKGFVMLKIKISNMDDMCVNEENALQVAQVDSSVIMPEHLSYKKVSVNQTKRNYLRGQKFKHNPAKRLRSESFELPRSMDLDISKTDQKFDLSMTSIPDFSLDEAVRNSECLDVISVSHEASVHEECLADQEACALERSVDVIKQIVPSKSADPMIPDPTDQDIQECDNVSMCSDFSDNPRSTEPCEFKGCSYGPPLNPGESRDNYSNETTIYYCCECKNNPFLPDVRWCPRCLIVKNRHRKHKRHARDIHKHEVPLGHRTWAIGEF